MFHHFLLSLPSLPRNSLTYFIVFHGPFALGVLLFVTFVLGIFCAYHFLHRTRATFLILHLAILLGVAADGAMLYLLSRGPLAAALAILAIGIMFMTVFALGCRAHLFLRQPGALLWSGFIVATIVIMYIVTNLNIKTQYDKEELSGVYARIFGSSPDEAAKEQFWRNQIGQSQPSKEAKSSYWSRKER
jgi:hypothetical protein